jgi:hypothetical protein
MVDRGGSQNAVDNKDSRQDSQDSDLARLDREWTDDLEAFNHHQVMRSGYEETREGNSRLAELRQQAAPLVAMGSSIQGVERKMLVDCYDRAYHKDALKAILVVQHPHMLNQNLNKTQIIGKLIDLAVGFPSIQDWLRYLDRAADLARSNLSNPSGHGDEGSDGNDSDDSKADDSKARQHDRVSSSSRTRPLQVVKRHRGRQEGNTSQLSS